ncbi:alpha/beta fold hydrolase [Zhongshania guokunii]|uniref:Alpha/beta fold hydrolase n=1 Tax=Zhongshania guokunii TaxID=641783 RepID=A0ABV3UAJ1_9GAMM
MSECQERRFLVDGLNICGKQWRSAGIPAIALHGWLDNAASFDALASALPELHLLALDMPGHGLSDHKPASGNYAIWDDLRFVLAVADQMGWPQFVLLGHSRGAIMASLLAGAAPARISHLICIDGLLPEPQDPTDFPAQLGKYLHDFAQPSRGDTGYASFAEALAARHGATPMSDAAARLIVARGSYRDAAGRVFWRSDRRVKLASPVKLSLLQVQATMAAITAPSLLIVADQGFGRWQAKLPEGLMAKFEIHSIAGEHHCHMDAQALDMARWIREFINRSGVERL